ncbi:unnamed protein product [Schistosoma mattheei]|uniref:Uncharacterized protein n=1 Tax=Schistosoma mattheei TaxID=31246 RepID=A0A183PPV2_9TREM|nr:unnamed protein product [Schistosoma mattheei]
MKQLCDTTKKLEGKYSKPEHPLKNKEGKPIAEIQEKGNRLVEHFEELLNKPAPLNPLYIEAAFTDLPADVNSSMKLDGSVFANDLALLSHTHSQMQVKIASEAAASASVSLNIHKGKNKTLKYYTANTNPITLDGEAL